jgi:hypothetical protein
MNAWGCDRCQQMMPAAPPPGRAPKAGGWTHAPQTQAEKTRTFILLGALVVAVIGVIIMLASDDKGSDEEGEAPAVEATGEAPETAPPPAPTDTNTTPPPPAPAPTPTPTPAPAPAPPAGQATTPKGAPIAIAECAELVELRKKVEACAAIPDSSKTTLYGMVDNKMSVFDSAPPTGDYAEMVRTKCAGTGEALRESLTQAACQ